MIILFFISVLPNTYPDRYNASFAGLAGSTGSISGQMTDMDETSMDNSSVSLHSSLNALNSLSTEASNILQSAIDKTILAEAQEIISNLQIDGHNNNEIMNNNYNNEIIKEDPDEMAIVEDNDEFEDEISSLMDGPLLTEQEIAFSLQPPALVSNYLNYHYICESGSRILFLSIFWFKKFHTFRLLR